MSFEHPGICSHCGVFNDEHDYQHLARECYPKQLSALRQELLQCTARTEKAEELVRRNSDRAYELQKLLDSTRQELRETAAAYVAMREALPPHDSCCSSLDTHERDALGRWPDCDCDLGRVLAQPLAALVTKVKAERAELQAYRDAAEYDALMSGPVFKGWNRSQLDRARKLTEAALSSPEARK